MDIASFTHDKNNDMLEVETSKNKLDTLVCSTSCDNAHISNDELNQIKKRISSLDSTLNTCIANNEKLMNVYAKSHKSVSKKPIVENILLYCA